MIDQAVMHFNTDQGRQISRLICEAAKDARQAP